MNNIIKISLLLYMLPMVANAQFISDDDKLHVGAGALISGATYKFVYTKTKNKKKAFWMSLGTSVLAGLSKEIYDSTKRRNRFDIGELLATTVGGFTTSISLNIFFDRKKQKSTSLNAQQ